MDALKETGQRADVRDYLAAERTFLAWVRTGLALMGFGFVVARFGLFLQQLQVFQRPVPPSSSGLSLWFGTALIVAGVVVNLFSAWRHTRLVRELDKGKPAGARSLTLAVATALFLALVGLAMAIYLVSVRGSANFHSQTDGYSDERAHAAKWQAATSRCWLQSPQMNSQAPPNLLLRGYFPAA